MPKLYSYVVDHDLGFAPNPFGGFCTLAKCKYASGGKRNIVELAEGRDWIAGTGGADLKKSAGHGKLIYAMRVDEIVPLDVYCEAHQGDRADAEPEGDGSDRLALISHHFFYFGRNAIDISEIPHAYLDHPFEKAGPGHRCDFTEEFVAAFAGWLTEHFRVGVHGPPCLPHSGLKLPRCPTKVRRKGWTPAIYPAWKAIVGALGVVGKQVHDARLVAVCHAHGVTHLLTFNVAHFARLATAPPGVTVIDPATV